MQAAAGKEGLDLDLPLSALVNSIVFKESYADILFKRSDFGLLGLLPV